MKTGKWDVRKMFDIDWVTNGFGNQKIDRSFGDLILDIRGG